MDEHETSKTLVEQDIDEMREMLMAILPYDENHHHPIITRLNAVERTLKELLQAQERRLREPDAR